MRQAVFILLLTIPYAAIIWLERKNLKYYVALGVFALCADIVFEAPFAVPLGFWNYYGTAQLFGISVWTLILYIHYLGFCYFLGNKSMEWMK